MLNIYERVNEIRKKVAYAQKDKQVTGAGYLAVTHDAVTALLRNHLIEQGIVVVPRLLESSVTDVGKTQKDATIIRYAARFEIDFVNCDNPEDRITVTGEAHANDSGDKAPGKATSYATKYAMLKLFSIETGEDEEGRVEPYASIEKVSAQHLAELEAKLTESGADRGAFLRWLRVTHLADVLESDFEGAMIQLGKAVTRSKKAAESKPADAPAEPKPAEKKP